MKTIERMFKIMQILLNWLHIIYFVYKKVATQQWILYVIKLQSKACKK
jgi:hypothetical protein